MAQENEKRQAAKKELPIRAHDTGTYRGRRSVREAVAERVLRNDASSPEGQGLNEDARESIEATLAAERAKGRSRGTRVGTATAARGERAVLQVKARTDQLAKLKLDTLMAGEKYMDSLKKSGIVAPGDAKSKKGKQAERMTGLHQTYAQMMALSALAPLRQGISAPAVVRTIGMTSAMFLLSPNFRSVIKGLRPNVSKAIKNRIEARRDKQGDKALNRLERAESRGKGRDSLSGKWQRRLDRVERAERGDRDPFTAHSAGLTEVALLESAYAAMRDPRVSQEHRAAHMAEVQASLDSAMSTLNDYIAADGLDREEVSREARMIIGHRLEAEPELASVFAETGHGRFVRSPAKEMFVVGETEPRQVWVGGFVDAVTDREVNRGSFSLRPPANRGEHVVLSARTLGAELEDATTLGELNDMFASYTAASVVRRFPGMSAEVEDPVVQERMGRAEAMFASMRADGISQTDQRYVYAASFVQAMEGVGEKNPELIAQWEAQYGPAWRENVQEAVQHYSDMGTRIEKDRLVSALVEKGFNHTDAEAEVTRYQDEVEVDGDGPEAITTSWEPEPLDESEVVERREAFLDQGFQVPPLADGLSRQDRALTVMGAMSDYVAADLAHEAAREGFYAPGATELSGSEGVEGEAWVGAEVFLGKAMGDWSSPETSAALGKEAIETGAPLTSEQGRRANRRRVAVAQAAQAMGAMGFPQKTRDAMMAAAYARGVGKMVETEPRLGLAVRMHSVMEGGNGKDWQDQAYRAAMAGTVSGKAFERDRTAALSKATTAQRDEVEVEWSGKDPARSGYAAWERQFDRLDNVDVPGQAKIGELDGPGPDTVRDQVATEVSRTAADKSGADRERKVRTRRSTHIKARINQDYNKGPSTGRLTGIGKDEAQILQDDDPTLGY